jgi:hypothetical protein
MAKKWKSLAYEKSREEFGEEESSPKKVKGNNGKPIVATSTSNNDSESSSSLIVSNNNNNNGDFLCKNKYKESKLKTKEDEIKITGTYSLVNVSQITSNTPCTTNTAISTKSNPTNNLKDEKSNLVKATNQRSNNSNTSNNYSNNSTSSNSFKEDFKWKTHKIYRNSLNNYNSNNSNQKASINNGTATSTSFKNGTLIDCKNGTSIIHHHQSSSTQSNSSGSNNNGNPWGPSSPTEGATAPSAPSPPPSWLPAPTAGKVTVLFNGKIISFQIIIIIMKGTFACCMLVGVIFNKKRK